MKIPQIDFKYWVEKNQIDSINENRFIRLITKIVNLYELNNRHKQAYFCGDNNEVSRLKGLDYIALENEIITKIRDVEDDLENENDILKIFDLIQIWGGLYGGSNFYNIVNNSSLRLEYSSWLPKYKELIRSSVSQNKETYEIVAKGEIPNLRISFGSKHISFWSRKKDDNKCLIIIDNKIAGVSGATTALDSDYKDILLQIQEYATQFNFKPYEIEKALFSFHRSYFNNSNSKFYGETTSNNGKDFESALTILHNLEQERKTKIENISKRKSNNSIVTVNKKSDDCKGILASIDWNSNNWIGVPTLEDIDNSKYVFVKLNKFSYTFLNFGHNLFPTNENGYYQACLPCLFSKKLNSDKEIFVDVVFIYSLNWRDNKKYIVGLYAFPKFEKTTKPSPVNSFNKDIIVNMMSFPEDIHFLENKYELPNPVQKELLPTNTKLSKQSFNYLTINNVINIFKRIIAINANDEILQNIASRVIR